MQDKLLKLIDNLDESHFLLLLNNLSEKQLSNINYNVIDNELKNNRDFSLLCKLMYAKKYRPMYYQEILEYLEEDSFYQPFEAILYVIVNEEKNRNRYINELVLRSCSKEFVDELTDSLKEYELYDDYVNKIKCEKDLLVKLHFAVYFDHIEDLFENPLNVAKLIVESDDELFYISNCKSHLLIKLAGICNDHETIDYIANNLVNVVKKENEKMKNIFEVSGYKDKFEGYFDIDNIEENLEINAKNHMEISKEEFNQVTGIKIFTKNR